jgi:FkbM family methyltransferase
MSNNAAAHTLAVRRLLGAARALLRRAGVDLVRYPWLPPNHLRNYLRLFAINTVLDVGANSGQYASSLRRAGYTGTIVSFEPARTAFLALQRSAAGDPRWSCYQLALGAEAGEAVLNVAAESEYSSFLPVAEQTFHGAASARQQSVELVRMTTLDTIWPAHTTAQSRVLLKLDTQGFEREILRGATASLPWLVGIQLELSVSAAYIGQPTIEEMLPLLRAHGFQLFALYEGFRDSRTGQLVELDGLFFRDA